jgi:hypothetical protein
MKCLFKASTLCVLVFTFLLISSCRQDQNALEPSSALATPQSVEGAIIPNQYILFFKADEIAPAVSYLTAADRSSRASKVAAMQRYNQQVSEEIQQWLGRKGIGRQEVLFLYTSLRAGLAVRLTSSQLDQLRKDPVLDLLEYDRVESLPDYSIESVDDPTAVADRAQTLPCGITNAGGYSEAQTARWIWIIDTGIDLDHPDLNVVTDGAYAVSFVGGTADDCNGHGSHVAGSAAARNNSIGVVGVAAGAPVVPVRVLGCTGTGTTSGILAGINHVGSNDFTGDVANLSLGGYYGANCATGSPYVSVLNALAAGGTRIALAAGNNFSSATLYQPACVNGNQIFTVANMRCNKTFYNQTGTGSNYGRPPIDWIATGTSVYSTYKNGGYATLTGTSMATPHVSGIMQIRNAAPVSGGNVTFNGVLYPIAVR